VSVITPLEDRVLVRKQETNRVLDSGLVLPETMREESDRGTVLEVGPGRLRDDGTVEPMPVTAGDGLLLPVRRSQLVVAGKEYLILRLGDVLGSSPTATSRKHMSCATLKSEVVCVLTIYFTARIVFALGVAMIVLVAAALAICLVAVTLVCMLAWYGGRLAVYLFRRWRAWRRRRLRALTA
jgi:chaperonin GroES